VVAISLLEEGFRLRRYAENEREALLKAALLLEAEGWAQGMSQGADGGYCLSQAIVEVTGIFMGASNGAKVWGAAVDLVAQEVGVASVAGLVGWNDVPGRTQQEVVDLLRRVASRL
jgi:hypothetical protein